MKIKCEDCDKVEAQITYRIRNTEWSSCFACLKVAITDKESARLMFQGVDDSTD